MAGTPVIIQGSTSGGQPKELLVDNDGTLHVTSAVSGSVSVTQGTSPWVVSNSGTFVVQATLATETTKVIGTVNQGTSPWVVSNSGTFSVQAAQSTASSLNAQVVGNVASAATDSGNPVKVGAVVVSSPSTSLTVGTRQDLQVNQRGQLLVALMDPGSGNQTAAISATNDGIGGQNGLVVTDQNFMYNGTSWDRVRGDTTNGLWVQIKSPTTFPVSGTFWQATQPVSAASLPLPTGAATETTLTAGTQKAQIYGLTNTTAADVVAGDSGNNILLVGDARMQVSASTTTAQAIASTDVSNWSSVAVHITAQGTNSTVTFQVSNDNTNWLSTTLSVTSNIGASQTQATSTTTGLFVGQLSARYFRLNVTGISAGTTSVVVDFFSLPKGTNITAVVGGKSNNTAAPAANTQVGVVSAIANAAAPSWTEGFAVMPSVDLTGNTRITGVKTNNNAAPGGTNLGALVGIANAAAPSWSEGNEVLLSTDLTGNLRVVSAGMAPAATALNTYAARITSNTTTTPTSTTSYISSIVLTTEVAGTTSTVTIRDKQGTPFVLVNGLTTTAASLTPTVINFQTPVKMTSGIDIVTAGAVAGTVDAWVNYYQ